MGDGEKRIDKDFHHPYKPYRIQQQFMTELYDCIEEGKVGIFESPTGTGKSLSLICGSLTWLREHKRKTFEEETEVEAEDDDEPAWFVEHAQAQKRQTVLRQRTETEHRLAKIRDREWQQKRQLQSQVSQPKKAKIRKPEKGSDDADEKEDAFLVIDDEVPGDGTERGAASGSGGLSAETQELMKKFGTGSSERREDDEWQAGDDLKIIYCSRTHSQITQFVNELRRVSLPSSVPSESPDHWQETPRTGTEEEEEASEGLRTLTLGSRKNLCINPKVTRLGGATLMNERCLELQEPGTPKDHKCPYLPTRENVDLVHEFRDHTLATIRDIEDSARLGQKLGVCPYYASRASIKPSEIVTIPYPSLLQKGAREALGLSVKGNVVIIDEAHNVMDAIADIHSVSISLAQLGASGRQLNAYRERFHTRLKGKNLAFIRQLIRITESIVAFVKDKAENEGTSDVLVNPSDLVAAKSADQINIHELLRYMKGSKLAMKVEGWAISSDKRLQEQAGNRLDQRFTDSQRKPELLLRVQNFLEALASPSAEGRFLYVDPDDGEPGLKYVLLDPSYQFRELVEEARAVILAGGTMSPIEHYSRYLFPYLGSSQMRTVSCGHVIPPSNLIAWPVSTGPSGSPLSFTFGERSGNPMVKELGLAVISLCQHIPDGVVAFFPSYAYLDQVLRIWRLETSKAGTIWDQLAQHKQIFQEASASPNTEDVLSSYRSTIDAGKGAILLAIVGGKMSEGINFSDQLGRGVIVVGLPYPYANSEEMQAKLGWIEDSHYNRVKADQPHLNEKALLSSSSKARREFYDDICMRKVNQTIGRAIRHQNDYAAIVLLDKRFSRPDFMGKLPLWIRAGMIGTASEGHFQAGLSKLDSFFDEKQKRPPGI